MPARARRHKSDGETESVKKKSCQAASAGEARARAYAGLLGDGRRRPWGTPCRNAMAHLGWGPAAAAWRSPGSAVAAFPSDFFSFAWLGTLGGRAFELPLWGRCHRSGLRRRKRGPVVGASETGLGSYVFLFFLLKK
jgi:hypothetical protein